MSTSARAAAPLLLAAAAVAVCGIGIATAAPAAAQPGDSAGSANSGDGAATVPPVIGIIDGVWNAHVPPNAIVPRSPLDPFVQQFMPSTSEIRDFFGFLQQFRPPGPISPPRG